MSQSKSQKNRGRGWKREILEWSIMLSVLGIVYFMGWHTETSGRLQQALLWTGVIQPDIELSEKEKLAVDYNMPMISLDGELANLSDFRGDVVFLNFWATWCPPCIAEMPNIQSLYEQYGEKEGLSFVMISLDEDPAKAVNFLENRGFTFGSYRLNGVRPQMLQSDVIPTTFVIGRGGSLVSKKVGMANYNTAAFKRFLDNKLAD